MENDVSIQKPITIWTPESVDPADKEQSKTMKYMVLSASTISELVLWLECIFEMFPDELSDKDITYLRSHAKKLKEAWTDYLDEYESVEQIFTDLENKQNQQMIMKYFDDTNDLLTL